MTAPRTILFAGGGTGGHLFPGIAVADELRRRDPSTRIVFVGSNRSIESAIVAEQGIEHRILSVEPLPVLKQNPIRFVYRNWQALRAARRLIRELQPSAIVGLGGYASAPLVWAARRTGSPVVLLEQNVIPGKTNRWLSRFAAVVCVSFAETQKYLSKGCRLTVTGNPVRKEIASLRGRRTVPADLSLDESRENCLLILGGSQGADSLNAAVVDAVRKLSAEMAGWRIVHQTGPRDVAAVRTAYEESGIPAHVEPFFKEMADLYAAADLAISRSGATTLAELACAGIGSILVPFPYAADDHQTANARAFVEQDAAVMVQHAANLPLTEQALMNALRPLLTDRERRCRMGQAASGLAHFDAARLIGDVIEDVATRQHSPNK